MPERPGRGGSLQAGTKAKRAPISHPETLEQVPNLLMLQPFNTAALVVVTPDHKVTLPVMNCNVNIRYIGYLICDPSVGLYPQVENCCLRKRELGVSG